MRERLDAFEVALASTLGGVATGGLVGLLLAVAGVFDWLPAVVAGAVGAAATAWSVSRRGLRPLENGWPLALVLLFAVAAAGLAVHHRSNHVLTDRDPGVYAVTGIWTAATGGLVLDDGLADVLPEAISGTDDALGFHDAAGDHSARPQFPHLFPTYLATAADAVSPGALFAVAPLFGALALLAVFALGRELVHPWLAAAATALVAVTLPQLQLSREVLSEPPAQAFVFGGLWAVVVAWRRCSPALAAVGGLLLGAGVGVRLDLVLGLLALVVLDVAAQRDVALRPMRNAAAAGAAVALAVCAADLVLRSPLYVEELAAETAGLAAVVVAAAVVGRVVVPRAVPWLRDRRRAVATVVGVGVAAAFVLLWLVRPHLQTVRHGEAAIVGALQAADGVEVDPTRRYWEESVRWLAWYLGIPALALGGAGWALLARDAVARRAPAVRVLAVVLSVAALLALVRPSISPDHPWAARRYLPLVLPGLALCAAHVLQRLERPRVGALALVALAVPAVATSWPTLDAREQRGVLGLLDAACEDAAPNALFVVEDDSYTEQLAGAPLRALCQRPVAAVPSAGDVAAIDEAAAAVGLDAIAVELRYEGSEPRPLGAEPTGTLVAVDDQRLAPTIVRPPSELATTTWTLLLWD